MEVQDELYLTEKRRVPSGTLFSSCSIADQKIGDLIAALEREGVNIDPAQSEQDITYRIHNVERTVTVPLEASFGVPVSVGGYTLRNQRLEIQLENYHHSTGGNNRIGGMVMKEVGIHCTLKFSGTYEEAKVVDTAKQVLQDMYMPQQKLL